MISRDVLGGKPIYYGRNLNISSFKSYIDGDAVSVMPGEVLKLDYTGEVIERKKYSFDDVFTVKREDEESMVEIIEKALFKIKMRVGCVAFSGGVDSSLLAAIYDLPLISVTASKEEEEWLKKAARMIGRDLEVRRVEKEEVLDAAKVVSSTIESDEFLQLSIGVPVYLALEFAKSQGYSEVIFGQGADELFGGYKRYESMEGYELENALIEDLKNIGENNLVRDVKLSYRTEVKLVTPYLDWEVIDAALKIPPELKVRREGGRVIRKYILRKIAENYLPEEIAWRDKKAIQYSTGIAKILKKYL